MANDSTAAQAQVDALVAKALATAKADVERSVNDVKLTQERQAADVAKLDAEIARLKVREIANTPAPYDGPAGNLVREFGRDAELQLLPTVRQYSFDGQIHREHVDGLLTSAKTYGDAHREVKDLWDAIQIRLALRGVSTSRASSAQILRDAREHAPEALARMADRIKRMGLASDGMAVINRVFGVSAGNGSDFIPSEVMSPEMLRVASAAIMDSPVGLFIQKTLTDKNMVSPVSTARPRPYLQGAASGSAAAEFINSAMATGKLSYGVKDMACAVIYDRNADMDSIIAFLPETRAQVAEAMALGLFDGIINGDTNTAHQDSLTAWAPEGVFPVGSPSGGSAVGGSLDHRRSFLGLRARAMDIGATAKYDLASTYTFAKIQAMQAKMGGGVGQNNGRVAIFASFQDILAQFSVMDQIATLEKFGPQATILTGQVGAVGGKPVIRAWPLGRTGSETGAFHTDGLHSATAGNNTKGGVVMVDLDRYILGTRQGLRLETDTNILTNTGILVASGRYAFESPDHLSALSATSTVNVVYGYNAS
jgi:hypothetical protein